MILLKEFAKSQFSDLRWIRFAESLHRQSTSTRRTRHQGRTPSLTALFDKLLDGDSSECYALAQLTNPLAGNLRARQCGTGCLPAAFPEHLLDIGFKREAIRLRLRQQTRLNVGR